MSSSSIPEEIQIEILLRLPVKSIFRFKPVCKDWYRLIRSPQFVNDHLSLTNQNPSNKRIMIRDTKNKSIEKDMFYSIEYDSILTASASSWTITCKCDGAVLLDYPTVKKTSGVDGRSTRILGSCNGLLCLSACNSNTLILWNPSTKEYKEIILPYGCLCLPSYGCSYGFGYDSKASDYKVVCKEENEVFVYTLKSNTWRRVDSTISYMCFNECGGLLLNGALHWTGDATNEINRDIVAFELSSEKFMNFSYPEEILPLSKDTCCELRLLGDSLCLVCGYFNNGVDVWIMQNYGVRESWTKLYSNCYGVSPSLKPYWSFINGEILIQVADGFRLYEHKTGRTRFLEFSGIGSFGMLESQSYVESLVSLNAGTYTEKGVLKRKRG